MNMKAAPEWAVKLVAALEEHEEVHADDNDPHTCVKAILDDVPAEVRSYVAAWQDGYNARKNERAQGGIVKVPLSPAGQEFIKVPRPAVGELR